MEFSQLIVLFQTGVPDGRARAAQGYHRLPGGPAVRGSGTPPTPLCLPSRNISVYLDRVADLNHFYADPDHPDPAFHFNADPDLDPASHQCDANLRLLVHRSSRASFKLPHLHCGRPRLPFKHLKLLNFYFNADPVRSLGTPVWFSFFS